MEKIEQPNRTKEGDTGLCKKNMGASINISLLCAHELVNETTGISTDIPILLWHYFSALLLQIILVTLISNL